MVWQTLCPAIQRVKSVASERRGHDPFMMRLVKPAVDEGMVQTTVNPIDSTIGEADEERVLQECISPKRRFAREVIKFGPSADLGNEEGNSENGHDGHCTQSLVDLLADLVGKVAGMLEKTLIEERVV